MIALVAVVVIFYWEDILAELGDWLTNFTKHRYTGALIFALGIGGLLYWMISVRKGWNTVAFMTFWFLISWVGVFLGLIMFTEAGVAIHQAAHDNFWTAIDSGDMTGAGKVIVTTIALPLAFVTFAIGGFAVLFGLFSKVDPTEITKAASGGVSAGPIDGLKHRRKSYKKHKTSNAKMAKKLGRKR